MAREAMLLYLEGITTPETIAGARLVLQDVKRSASDHGRRMALAGQPYFAADYILLALREGEMQDREAIEVMAAGFEALAGWEKDPDISQGDRLEAQILRGLLKD